jgi:hypothetical protein
MISHIAPQSRTVISDCSSNLITEWIGLEICRLDKFDVLPTSVQEGTRERNDASVPRFSSVEGLDEPSVRAQQSSKAPF